jgi:putative hydrolase of the HAD superfamily
MIPAAVRAIFFDAVGTVIFPDPPAASVYAAVAQRYGSCLPLDVIEGRFREAFRREEAFDHSTNGLRTDEEREERRWRHIVAAVLDDVTDGEACFRELFEHFSRPEAWRCAPGVAETLAELSRRGYRLGLASNYDRRLRAVAAGLPELRSLDCLVISSEVGWRKPARQFFESVVRQAGVPPEEVLFVGDDPVNDEEGARAAGLQTILLDPRGLRGLRGRRGHRARDRAGSCITRMSDLL